MTEDDISHLNGLDYSKSLARRARERRESGASTPASSCAARRSSRCSEVAEAGESMPPKSTYFYPKIPTGLVFNLLR